MNASLPGDIATLVEQVTALGGTIPNDLRTVIDAITAVNDWTPPEPADIGAICLRGDLTADNANSILDDALIQPNRRPGDIKVTAKFELTKRFTRILAGPAGDELIESIRPTFTAACSKVAKAAELVDVGDRVDILESADDDTIAAWRTLGEHKVTLDRINAVIDTLTEQFGVLGGPQPWHFGNVIRASVYTPTSEHIASVTQALRVANGAGSARGGKWHAIARALKLNTLTEARQILAEALQAHLEQVAADRNNLTTNKAEQPSRPRGDLAAFA